jgi:SAM-dependent methyltransferase
MKAIVVRRKIDWLDTGTGRRLLLEESRRIRQALEGMFGDQFIQIGEWRMRDYREFSRTRRSSVVSDERGQGGDLVSALDCLAIADDSVDVALLPHILEAHDDPHGVLREVDRILRSDGHIVILGFNPVSWWGFRHFLSRRKFPDGIQRMISEHRLRDWLRLLNFSVRPTSFQNFGSLISGGYLLVARKELFTVTPIKPAWKRPRRMVGQLVNPTTRNAA